MTERTLKGAFVSTTVLCLALAGALGYVLLHRSFKPALLPTDGNSDPVVARGPEAGSAAKATPAATSVEDAPLSPIQLSPQRMQQIGVATALVQMKDVSDELQAPGTVAMDEQRLAYVQTRFPGWIKNVYANATYQYVRKGQKLFTIYSPDLVSTEQEYLLAKQNQHTSSEHMHGTAAAEGNWLLQAATERLKRYDIPDSEIAQLEKTGAASREIPVESPVSGYIIERNALPNAYVQPETKLYSVADLSTVWVYANVPQAQVGRLKPGDRAQVDVDAYPGRKFSGHIDQILPEVDAATRTVRVRLVMSNPGTVLKPGMYVGVTISAPLGRQLVVPASGVLQAGTRQIAFIDRGRGVLEPREIQTGPRLDDSIVVLKGLKEGDRIVSSANFLVDSEANLRGITAISTPSTSADSASTPSENDQLQIDFSTLPSPPRRGSNTLRVVIKGPDGKPMPGLQATVSFFMPAMPAMGMAAMRATANLTDRGNGTYEAPLQLDSGGTWQVTISIQRNGTTIATKQLSVTATGGM